MPTPSIDLSDHALPYEMRGIRRAFNDADKLVSERALKSGIPAHDLHIRITNSRERHVHQSLALAQGLRNLRDREATILIT
jgi:hypothetical protein